VENERHRDREAVLAIALGSLERHDVVLHAGVADLGLPVERLKSGPWGGDAQLGARIAEGGLDALIFFTDPLSALPHDVDVKTLLRLAVLYDVPLAMSPATADLLIAGLGL
jgi:methylglyoxal synthase